MSTLDIDTKINNFQHYSATILDCVLRTPGDFQLPRGPEG